jgi:hypothetical protein
LSSLSITTTASVSIINVDDNSPSTGQHTSMIAAHDAASAAVWKEQTWVFSEVITPLSTGVCPEFHRYIIYQCQLQAARKMVSILL